MVGDVNVPSTGFGSVVVAWSAAAVSAVAIGSGGVRSVELNNSSKCVLYRTFKRNFVFENYLTTLSPHNRKLFCKFRTINHKLPIEVGRYSGRPRFTRNCDKCDMEELGDKFHFLLQCPTLSDLRRTYLPIYCQNRPNIHKFKSIMSSNAIAINIK